MATANGVPAIRVTLNKRDGENGGGATTFFARLCGVESVPISTTAVAVITSPGIAGPESMLPLAMAKYLFDNDQDPVRKSESVTRSA